MEQHLKLLLNGTNTAFVNEISPGNYTIPFSHLTNILKQNNFEALVKATLEIMHLEFYDVLNQ